MSRKKRNTNTDPNLLEKYFFNRETYAASIFIALLAFLVIVVLIRVFKLNSSTVSRAPETPNLACETACVFDGSAAFAEACKANGITLQKIDKIAGATRYNVYFGNSAKYGTVALDTNIQNFNAIIIDVQMPEYPDYDPTINQITGDSYRYDMARYCAARDEVEYVVQVACAVFSLKQHMSYSEILILSDAFKKLSLLMPEQVASFNQFEVTLKFDEDYHLRVTIAH